MTGTWKPSDGLKRAEGVAQQIVAELAAAGIQIEPMYQWRMTQVVGAAIDEALAGTVTRTVTGVVTAVSQAVSHSITFPSMTSEEVAVTLTDMASEISDDMQDAPQAAALHAAGNEPKKRGRGRPPGPGKKKDKKAGKKKADAAAPDAAMAA